MPFLGLVFRTTRYFKHHDLMYQIIDIKPPINFTQKGNLNFIELLDSYFRIFATNFKQDKYLVHKDISDNTPARLLLKIKEAF